MKTLYNLDSEVIKAKPKTKARDKTPPNFYSTAGIFWRTSDSWQHWSPPGMVPIAVIVPSSSSKLMKNQATAPEYLLPHRYGKENSTPTRKLLLATLDYKTDQPLGSSTTNPPYYFFL